MTSKTFAAEQEELMASQLKQLEELKAKFQTEQIPLSTMESSLITPKAVRDQMTYWDSTDVAKIVKEYSTFDPYQELAPKRNTDWKKNYKDAYKALHDTFAIQWNQLFLKFAHVPEVIKKTEWDHVLFAGPLKVGPLHICNVTLVGGVSHEFDFGKVIECSNHLLFDREDFMHPELASNADRIQAYLDNRNFLKMVVRVTEEAQDEYESMFDLALECYKMNKILVADVGQAKLYLIPLTRLKCLPVTLQVNLAKMVARKAHSFLGVLVNENQTNSLQQREKWNLSQDSIEDLDENKVPTYVKAMAPYSKLPRPEPIPVPVQAVPQIPNMAIPIPSGNAQDIEVWRWRNAQKEVQEAKHELMQLMGPDDVAVLALAEKETHINTILSILQPNA